MTQQHRFIFQHFILYIQVKMSCFCKRPLKYICSRKSCKEYLAICDSHECNHFAPHSYHSKFDISEWLTAQEAINKQREQEQKQTNILLSELKKQLNWIKSNQFRLNPCAKFLTLMRRLRKEGSNIKLCHDSLDKIDEMLQTRITRRQKAVSNSRESLNHVLDGIRDMIKKCKQIVHSAIENDGAIMEDNDEKQDEGDIDNIEDSQKMVQQENNNKSREQPPSLQKNINQREKSFMKYFPESSQKEIITPEDRKFIIDSFGDLKIKCITKIYTGGALQHQFKQSIFRQKCGNLKNTLLVAQYAKQNTKTPNKSYFAGFTPLEIWNDRYRQRQMQKDPSCLSRIFWFRSDREEKRLFKLKSSTGENALLVDERYGIIFGSDLIINLRGGQKTKAINLGMHYHTSPPLSLDQQKDIDYINDSVRGRTLEYQLYQIQFEQLKMEQKP